VLQLDAIGSPTVVLNPRRASFPLGQPDATREQTTWEYQHLRLADVILFWFCAEAVQPIALYELGAHAARGTRLAVGTHPAYPRRLDVLEQLRLARPDVSVHDSLHATVRAAAALLPPPPPPAPDPRWAPCPPRRGGDRMGDVLRNPPRRPMGGTRLPHAGSLGGSYAVKTYLIVRPS
jgi:hypothetical protein